MIQIWRWKKQNVTSKKVATYKRDRGKEKEFFQLWWNKANKAYVHWKPVISGGKGSSHEDSVPNWVLKNRRINVEGKPGKKQHASQAACWPPVFGETENGSIFPVCTVFGGERTSIGQKGWKWDRVPIMEDFVSKTLPVLSEGNQAPAEFWAVKGGVRFSH